MTIQVATGELPLYAGQSVSIINNDRDTVAPFITGSHSVLSLFIIADHGSHIIKVIGGAKYRQAQDHIHECHPYAVKPDMHTKVEVAGQPITILSTSEADQQVPTAPAAQPPVSPATSKQAAAQSPKAATHIQQMTPATADVPPLNSRTDIVPCQSAHVSKTPQI